jgi:hypothetical protein
MGMRTLLIDDIRDIGADVTARNAEVAKSVLAGPLVFDKVYFDHDLGPDETGHDVLVWMLVNGIRPPMIVLVTMNPVGLRNMENVLAANGYTKTATRTWVNK